jgi:nicotinamidase-related amidase
VSVFRDRPNRALLVVDVQRDVVANAYDRDKVVANIGSLVERARAAEVPVIWVQHADEGLPEGSEGWEYVEELQRDEATEPLVHKHFGDSFEDTELETLLADLGVGHLIVAGAQTDACIRSTLHGALVRGYDATLVSDAHTTDDPSQWGVPLSADQVIAHTNMYWSDSAAPGRRGRTQATAEVDFRSGVD